ncbi:MAG: Imm27 family immunity protein [Enhydrobacter sp.]
MHPQPDETELNDAPRIYGLIGGRFQKLGHSGDGWDTLYRDTVDGRFWELTYPQSHMHGGGPPRLTMLHLAVAKAKYRLDG